MTVLDRVQAMLGRIDYLLTYALVGFVRRVVTRYFAARDTIYIAVVLVTLTSCIHDGTHPLRKTVQSVHKHTHPFADGHEPVHCGTVVGPVDCCGRAAADAAHTAHGGGRGRSDLEPGALHVRRELRIPGVGPHGGPRAARGGAVGALRCTSENATDAGGGARRAAGHEYARHKHYRLDCDGCEGDGH
eukprot:3329169-Rhodomonas_salina.1